MPFGLYKTFRDFLLPAMDPTAQSGIIGRKSPAGATRFTLSCSLDRYGHYQALFQVRVLSQIKYSWYEALTVCVYPPPALISVLSAQPHSACKGLSFPA